MSGGKKLFGLCLTIALILVAYYRLQTTRNETEGTPLEPSAPPALSVNPGDRPAGIPPGAQKATVASNIDGDTISVGVTEVGGPLAPAAVYEIRLLEIDAPESTTTMECFGREASDFAKSELPVGSVVYLLADKEDKDQNGRFLRYVWDQEGEFYNDKAVRQGYAKAVLFEPNDLYIGQLREAEAEAKAAGRGLWGACTSPTPSPQVTPPRRPSPTPSASPRRSSRCDPSYPDFCVAPRPPDLDCHHVGRQNFTVRPPDPHGFDANRDGIGCEPPDEPAPAPPPAPPLPPATPVEPVTPAPEASPRAPAPQPVEPSPGSAPGLLPGPGFLS